MIHGNRFDGEDCGFTDELWQSEDAAVAVVVAGQGACVGCLAVEGGVAGEGVDCSVTTAEGASAVAAFGELGVVDDLHLIGVVGDHKA